MEGHPLEARGRRRRGRGDMKGIPGWKKATQKKRMQKKKKQTKETKTTETEKKEKKEKQYSKVG
jgi:hypothetical protein